KMIRKYSAPPSLTRPSTDHQEVTQGLIDVATSSLSDVTPIASTRTSPQKQRPRLPSFGSEQKQDPLVLQLDLYVHHVLKKGKKGFYEQREKDKYIIPGLDKYTILITRMFCAILATGTKKKDLLKERSPWDVLRNFDN